jgi:hypothetical protein
MDAALTLQVDSLGDLVEGWFDDGIEPYPVAALDWLAKILGHLVDAFKVPIPYVYPTAQGRVRAGWTTPRWDVIADIDMTTHQVDVVASRVAAHEIHGKHLQLETPGAEAQLGRFVAGHTK